MTFYTRPSIPAVDAPLIGDDLRAGDWNELRHMGYRRGRDAVKLCMDECKASVTAVEDGVPIAAWGYKPDDMLLSGAAYLWCMTTPSVERHKRKILQLSKAFCDDLLQAFARLESTVSPEYPEALRWVTWLGFKPTPGQYELVLNGMKFWNIVLEKDA